MNDSSFSLALALALVSPSAAPTPTLAPSVLGRTLPQNHTSLNSGSSNLVAPTHMPSLQNYQDNMGMQTPVITFPLLILKWSWTFRVWFMF